MYIHQTLIFVSCGHRHILDTTLTLISTVHRQEPHEHNDSTPSSLKPPSKLPPLSSVLCSVDELRPAAADHHLLLCLLAEPWPTDDDCSSPPQPDLEPSCQSSPANTTPTGLRSLLALLWLLAEQLSAPLYGVLTRQRTPSHRLEMCDDFHKAAAATQSHRRASDLSDPANEAQALDPPFPDAAVVVVASECQQTPRSLFELPSLAFGGPTSVATAS